MWNYTRDEWRRCKNTLQTSGKDHFRRAFNGWMKMTAKVKFPEQGDPMDYRLTYTRNEWRRWKLHSKRVEKMQLTLETSVIFSYDTATQQWVHWSEYVTPYTPVSNDVKLHSKRVGKM